MEDYHRMIRSIDKCFGGFRDCTPLSRRELFHASNDVFQFFHILFCFFQTVIREVERASVMGGKQEIAERIAGVFFQHIFDKEEIIKRFAHLF